MAWHFNRLSVIAEMVAGEIEETLSANFYVQGKEYDIDGNLIFTIAETGKPKLTAARFKLVAEREIIDKCFYEGMPEWE